MPERQTSPDEVTVARPEPEGAVAGTETAAADDEPTEVTEVPEAAEETAVVPAVSGPDAPPTPAEPGADEAPTEVMGVPPTRRRRRRVLVITGVVLGILAMLYVADLVQSAGTVPRGVTVVGERLGGLTPAEAEQRVRVTLAPRIGQPVAVAAGEVTSEIDPQAAGLAVDWAGTVARAGSQPLDPITRVQSFFTTREVGVATAADDEAVNTALEQLAPVVNRAPVEGSVRFDGVTPVPVPPADGQNLDLAAAREVLVRDWALGTTVRLPMTVLPPTTTDDDVAEAVAEVATPAVSGPVTVTGEKVTGTLTPETVAAALSFRADPNEGLVPELNRQVVVDALDPQFASSEQRGRSASIKFTDGKPVVTPSQDGRGVDWEVTLKDLLAVLTATGDGRTITAVYGAQPAEITTDQLNGFGITRVIGEFTTKGFAKDSGQNIRRAAQQVNGMIIKPGGTFSLNGATQPRSASNGYVEAGIIEDGQPSRGVGGGVSQLATTLYNAAYFAGMTDVTHKPHSFYISRYPAGREATVFEGAIDMQFKNDNPTGVLIETAWTPTSITVKLYGTKRYDVSSSTGPRTKPTQPTTVTVPAGQPCSASQGAPGFTVTDTRRIREISTGQVKVERRTVKYNPSPIVRCGSG